jgi:hypothetical protein
VVKKLLFVPKRQETKVQKQKNEELTTLEEKKKNLVLTERTPYGG